jgi:hypothetical protein
MKKHAAQYSKFQAVRNWDKEGVVFMWLARGYNGGHMKKHAKEIHVFYCNGQLWSGFGNTAQEAVEGAIRDGWMYTRNRLGGDNG